MQQGVGLGLVCTLTEDRFVVLPQVPFPGAGILVGEKVRGDVFRQLLSFPTPPPPVCLEVGGGGHLGRASLDRWPSCQGCGQREGCT